MATLAVVIESDLISTVTQTDDGETRRRLITVDPGTSARVLALDVIVEESRRALRGRDALVRMSVSDPRLREGLLQASFEMPNLVVERHMSPEVRPLLDEAVAAMSDHPMVVATDASRSRNGREAGIAAVTQDGRWKVRLVRSTDILHAELLAIELGMTHFRAVRPVVIASDNATAVNLINSYLATGSSPMHSRGRVDEVLCRIYRLAQERDVTVRWVRGHNGDPLNETADRLAVLARRTRLDDAASFEIANRIAGELVGALQERHLRPGEEAVPHVA